MGGMVSAQFACDYPERLLSLSLCDTTAGNRLGPDAAANAAEARGERLRSGAEFLEYHVGAVHGEAET